MLWYIGPGFINLNEQSDDPVPTRKSKYTLLTPPRMKLGDAIAKEEKWRKV